MQKDHFFIVLISITFFLCTLGCNFFKKQQVKSDRDISSRWPIQKAQKWGKNTPWLVGANFIPSTAINQLETWQAETFDPETIDRELGLAETIGFNCMRVYLHHLAWQIDRKGFKSRIEKYLSIADKHGIKTIFVFFDDCWNEEYHEGKQPIPKPGIHNSGWVRDPGNRIFQDPTLIDTLEVYVKDILNTFSNDNRIVLWDLYNEPGNNGLLNKSMNLLEKVFRWAREISPSQPVSSAVWNLGNLDLTDLNIFQLENSDIITYHNYEDSSHHFTLLEKLKKYNRPIICTEYMARTRGSRFDNILPTLKKEKVGAICWGFVAGKTNTIYAWDTPMPDGSEPKIWFHDLFRKNGTPYDSSEIELIKKFTGKL